MVPKGCGGEIEVNVRSLKTDWPSDFFTSLSIFRSTLSRQYEAGCRPIIALFLAYAVTSARSRFGADRLVVHSEIQVPNVQIPNVGLVGGTVDFITAPTLGKARMRNTSGFQLRLSVEIVMDIDDARNAFPEQPTFIIIEAKRSSTLSFPSSEAELFGQLKSQLLRR
jgi:hypothetical protein